MRRKYLKFISQASIKADYFDPNLYFEARRLGAYDVLYIFDDLKMRSVRESPEFQAQLDLIRVLCPS